MCVIANRFVVFCASKGNDEAERVGQQSIEKGMDISAHNISIYSHVDFDFASLPFFARV